MESTALVHRSRTPNLSFEDMVLVNHLMQALENDPNLSMLPDEFKQLALETMFDEAKFTQANRDSNIAISNKRRCTGDVPMEE